jgi:hypothetical protein
MADTVQHTQPIDLTDFFSASERRMSTLLAACKAGRGDR